MNTLSRKILSILLPIAFFGVNTLFGAAAPHILSADYLTQNASALRGAENSTQRIKVLNNLLLTAIDEENFEHAFDALQQGAQPNKAKRGSHPALAIAATKGCTDIVRILLLYGAQDIRSAQAHVQRKQIEDQELSQELREKLEAVTALLEAAEEQRDTQVRMKKPKRMMPINNALFQAIADGNVDVVGNLLGQGASIHARAPKQYNRKINGGWTTAAKPGDTPLIAAARLGDSDMVTMLLNFLDEHTDKTEIIVALTATNNDLNTAIEAAIRVAESGTKIKADKTFEGKPEIVTLLADFAREHDIIDVLNRQSPAWHLRSPLHSVVRRIKSKKTKGGAIELEAVITMITTLTKDNPEAVALIDEDEHKPIDAVQHYTWAYLDKTSRRALANLLNPEVLLASLEEAGCVVFGTNAGSCA